MSSGLAGGVFVGRGDEFGVLAAAFGAAGRTPGTVLVGGEAGIGKSRLVWEFASGVVDRALVLTGACLDVGGDSLPFAPVTAALRGLLDELGVDGVLGALPGQRPGELARLLPALGEPESERGDGGAVVARARLFEQVLGLLGRLGEQRPVVLVVEDAHWADRSSRDLLRFLIRNQQSMPGVLLVLTYRTDELPRSHPLRGLLAELNRLPWVSKIDLARLSKSDATAQMRGILGRVPESGLAELIYQRSDGNPLFVELLLESRRPAELPPSIGDLLRVRLDRLPARARRVVRAAAAGGARVGHRLLSTVTGLGDAALSGALRPAVDANVLNVAGDGSNDYVFRHALVRDAAYLSLLPGERIPLHHAYADAIEHDPALAPGARGAAEVAHHRFAAGDAPAALVAAWRAAELAGATLAHAERLAMLTTVLRLWHGVPDAAERTGTDRSTVLEAAATAALRAGEHARGVELATEALDAPDGLDRAAQPGRVALLLEQRARMRRGIGHPGDEDDLRAAVALAPEDDPALPFTLNSLATHLMEAPRPDESRAAAERALGIARHTGDEYAQAAALITLATLTARRGDLAGQLPRLAEARALAERAGARGVVLKAMQCESGLLLGFGEAERSADMARQALADVRAAGLARAFGAGHAIDLVGALFALGEWDEALAEIERALGLVPPPAQQAHLLCLRGLIGLYRGDLEAPAEAVTSARELLSGAPGFAQDPLRLPRLEILLRLAQGRVDEAMEVVTRSLALPYLPATPRFAWMLVTCAAEAITMARRSGDPGLSARAVPALAQLRAVAGSLPVCTPVQRADRLVYLAETARGDGRWDRAGWADAVREWEGLRRPYRVAELQVPAAEAALSGGDRGDATARLRHAAELAARFGAAPLLRRVVELARRARIPLPEGVDPDADSGDAAERVRREHSLTRRELEILRLVAAGRGNREIAAELFISAKTASVHVSNIVAKLGVANRVEAAATAHRVGLVP